MNANTNTNTNVREGDFLSLNLDENDRQMLEDAYRAITKANRWDFLRRPDVPGEHGFMFSKWDQLRDIDAHMEYGGHSGASYGWTMRNMEFIAKKGWDAFAVRFQRKPAVEAIRTTMQAAAAVDSVIADAKNKSISSPLELAKLMQQNPEARNAIPDLDNQVAALQRFAEGKMSYAEMRSLCG